MRAEDFCRAPKALADIAAELRGEHGKHPGPEAIAGMLGRSVRGVLTVTQSLPRGVGLDVSPPYPEPGPEDFQGHTVDLPDRPGAHPAQAGTASAKEIEEKSLDLIVCVMGENERAAAGLARRPGEEGIAGLPGGGFNGEPALPRQGGDIHAGGEDGKLQPAGEPPHEAGVGRARGTAEAVIEVEEGDFSKALLHERVEQRRGIDTAGDAGENAPIPRDARERE